MTGNGEGPSSTPLRLRSSGPRESPVADAAVARAVRARLVEIPAGSFDMGSEDADAIEGDGEGPVRRVEVARFLIGAEAVTVDDFASFVDATGYRTQSELFGWSFVFHAFIGDLDPRFVRGTAGGTPWWVAVDGADWRHPEGPGSTVSERGDHPVVHVSHEDAAAYCAWSSTRLPREKEWEYAARGGLAGKRYPWGDELTPGGRHMCNIWQGEFPDRNTAEDGYAGTAPVTAFPANGYGLHNMAGNVWEWTATGWSALLRDIWVIRGGSYLCHDSYCNRYRVAARTANSGDSSSGNTGFRVAADVED